MNKLEPTGDYAHLLLINIVDLRTCGGERWGAEFTLTCQFLHAEQGFW